MCGGLWNIQPKRAADVVVIVEFLIALVDLHNLEKLSWLSRWLGVSGSQCREVQCCMQCLCAWAASVELEALKGECQTPTFVQWLSGASLPAVSSLCSTQTPLSAPNRAWWACETELIEERIKRKKIFPTATSKDGNFSSYNCIILF